MDFLETPSLTTNKLLYIVMNAKKKLPTERWKTGILLLKVLVVGKLSGCAGEIGGTNWIE